MSGEHVDLNPTLAAIGSFWILLILVVGSALVDWLKKRNESKRADSTGTPPTPRAGDPNQAPTETRGDWEEELRRLLGAEPPRPVPPVVKPPPIPIPAAAPRPRLDVPPKPRPPIPVHEPAHMARIEPEFAGARKVATIQMPGLRESSVAYEHAAQLPEQVARHLKDVTAGTEQPGTRVEVIPTDSSPSDIRAMISLLRAPGTARQAIIATVILGTPKGISFEQSA